MPLVSIITVCRNPGEQLLATLASVSEQLADVPDLEHIIVDGASTDGTQERLRAWTRHRLNWISEPDHGISDAFNRGLARATGDLIGLINADDRYTPGAIARAVKTLAEHPHAGFCFGHCLHLEGFGRTWLNRADPHYRDHLRWFMPDINHPTMIVRRSAYATVGNYDVRYRYAMDYDWLYRATRAGVHGVHGVLVNATQAMMAMGGCSDRHWRKAYAEARDIAIRYGAPTFPAHVDHYGRIIKGGLRRTLVACGAHRTVHHIRTWRQARIIGAST